MAISVDKTQVQKITVSLEDGTSVEAYVIPVVVPLSEVPQHMANYDSDSSTHPIASQAKPIAKVVLDTIEAEEGA